MNRTIKQAAGGLAVALGIGAGCGHADVQQAHREPKQSGATIEQSLERLRALQIVDVEGLVLKLPGEATQCYGQPCPGTPWEKAYQDERARQAPRLERLVAVAEVVARDASMEPRAASESGAALAALAGLEVVQASRLIETKPANNPQCYNLPCESDIRAAEHENGLRVARVFKIVDEARRGGL